MILSFEFVRQFGIATPAEHLTGLFDVAVFSMFVYVLALSFFYLPWGLMYLALLWRFKARPLRFQVLLDIVLILPVYLLSGKAFWQYASTINWTVPRSYWVVVVAWAIPAFVLRRFVFNFAEFASPKNTP